MYVIKRSKRRIRFLCLFVGFNERSTENCAVEAVSDRDFTHRRRGGFTTALVIERNWSDNLSCPSTTAFTHDCLLGYACVWNIYDVNVDRTAS